MKDTYNGWANWQTWNVALWLGNDQYLYKLSRRFTNYRELAEFITSTGMDKTPDGASWLDHKIDAPALNEWLTEE